MWKRLFGRSPIRVWVIKQIDDRLLHLCGEGSIEPDGKRETTLEALHRRDYRGPVQMAGSGLVLNARLFAALVPHDGLHLGADGQAHWQGQLWRVARVPQRCWAYEGRLIAQTTAQGPLDLVSTEDTSGIRRRARADGDTRPGEVAFRAADELEHEAEFAARWRRDAVKPGRERSRRHDDD
ncbi:hypothetical protein [Halomonas koreensis]|uniref:Uncharacterized protein n=1 Tax=Halomonas koreensis TaxID=245385 RepID=A0ABU1FZ70_9GAMM|nr:hypothetical protein [Halomonas koreensis]MDR5865653.1 hypothetical protein [Halomonas koreensis]